ncbi:MAG: hypothetical protein JW940_20825 [Polyangiaceae bacterium]|nr:hypothetical protein [Polyangiaceae bacterium]
MRTPSALLTGEPDTCRAVSAELDRIGLTADPSEIHWADVPRGVLAAVARPARAVLRAHRANEPADIYVAEAALSPEGHLLRITGLYSLSETSAVDERELLVSGPRVAWSIVGAGRIYSVQYADLRGAEPPSGPDWTQTSRWQWRITNLQQLGQLSGVRRRSFRLEPAALDATLGFSADSLLVEADGRRVSVPTERDSGLGPESAVTEQRHPPGRPGNVVTWAVDRVRALPWFGSARMQLVKAVTFAALDRIERWVGQVSGGDGSQQVTDELGRMMPAAAPRYSDQQSGWPPPAMHPVLTPALEGEGQWRTLENDPFVGGNPNAPSPFALSFIRVDPERKYSQIFVTLWDPRQVDLNTMSGTDEPRSATGETGPGLVPRDPNRIGRLVAGFNGGFQATHGEFGMMADGVVYLPPKPYAATVARLTDGSTAFGTWPLDEDIPDDIVSFRQNLTPLVVDGTVNPYHRDWWGGVPPGWEDTSRTVRSGLCLTQDNFVAYFYGARAGVEHLQRAMQAARCGYGIHLDMNPGHTGLELYRLARASELPTPGRQLDADWEATGPVPQAPGWRFLARRMIRHMALMNFPRYIHRESRDFFYLTLRPILPGNNLQPPTAPAAPGEGVWATNGLPQHGWPCALATTWLRPDPSRPQTKVSVLRIDSTRLRPCGTSAAPALFTLRPGRLESDTDSVWWTRGAASIGAARPQPEALRLATGWRPGRLPPGVSPAAALGLDQDGMLVYAEFERVADDPWHAAVLDRLLEDLGCERVLLQAPLHVALGAERNLAGRPVAVSRSDQRFCRGEGPRGQRIFATTPVVPRAQWEPLQAKRVRYFRKPPAQPPEAAGADASGPTEPAMPDQDAGRPSASPPPARAVPSQ